MPSPLHKQPFLNMSKGVFSRLPSSGSKLQQLNNPSLRLISWVGNLTLTRINGCLSGPSWQMQAKHVRCFSTAAAQRLVVVTASAPVQVFNVQHCVGVKEAATTMIRVLNFPQNLGFFMPMTLNYSYFTWLKIRMDSVLLQIQLNK